jgi:hypothetical protein
VGVVILESLMYRIAHLAGSLLVGPVVKETGHVLNPRRDPARMIRDLVRQEDRSDGAALRFHRMLKLFLFGLNQ